MTECSTSREEGVPSVGPRLKRSDWPLTTTTGREELEDYFASRVTMVSDGLKTMQRKLRGLLIILKGMVKFPGQSLRMVSTCIIVGIAIIVLFIIGGFIDRTLPRSHVVSCPHIPLLSSGIAPAWHIQGHL